MSNNTPDYENNLAFEPAKTAGTMATIARDGKAVAIRCYIDNQRTNTERQRRFGIKDY